MPVTITALNGRLPAGVLTVADTGPNGPQRLRLDAAASRRRMIRDGCPAGHLRSGYRTVAQQEAEVARAKAGLTPSAAPPGKSFHGEGTATDDDPPAREWITTRGAPYGWISGRVKGEPWHHEYDPARDTYLEEDDMFSDTDRYALNLVLGAMGRVEIRAEKLLRAAGQPVDVEVDEDALAKALAPMLIPPIVAAVAAEADLTPAQVEAATSRAIRQVLGSLNPATQEGEDSP